VTIRERRKPEYEVVCDCCGFTVEGDAVPARWAWVVLQCGAQIGLNVCPQCFDTGVRLPTREAFEKKTGTRT